VTWRHEADQIRDRFLGVLSHELRTPVTSILQRLSNGFSEANCRSR
jgi:signal transduction histidine kinase